MIFCFLLKEEGCNMLMYVCENQDSLPPQSERKRDSAQAAKWLSTSNLSWSDLMSSNPLQKDGLKVALLIPWWQKPKGFLLFIFVRFRGKSLWPKSKRGNWDRPVTLAMALSKNWEIASVPPAWLLEPGTLNAARLVYRKIYQCSQAHLTSVCSLLIEAACAVQAHRWIVQASFCPRPWRRDLLLILVWI